MAIKRTTGSLVALTFFFFFVDCVLQFTCPLIYVSILLFILVKYIEVARYLAFCGVVVFHFENLHVLYTVDKSVFFFFYSSPDSSHTFLAVNCGVFWW